ncbi:MAG TPA: spermidine/putrescine ABC transporter substrate-binding protein [Gaiellaceae bacterium]|nr:spermidine/putrescine ABC transporter substrate-binding protein [Gaiellaceae bacterium]
MNEHNIDRFHSGRPIDRKGFVAGAAATVAALGLGRIGAPNALAGSAADAGELFYYNWADYVNPKTYPAFTKATGIKVKKDFYVSNEALLAKLKGGARGYDLIVPTGYMVSILAQEKLLQPIQWSRLPTVKRNINPKFRHLPFDRNDRFSVPKDWGTTGFMYRSDLVKERPTTWREFVALTKGKYSGKVTVLDGIPEVIGSMLVMLGYSYNTDNASQLDQAKRELIALKPHLRAITSTEYKQMLIAGKIVMALGWNGDGLAVAAKKPAAYVIPREGAEFWVDSYAIPVGAKNPDAAHRWIDYVYGARSNAVETTYTYYGSPLKPGLLRGVLAKSILGNPAIFPSASVLAKLQANEISARGTALRNRIWTEFKNA